MWQPFNVLRYEPGQHYDSHYDIFEPESYGPQASQRVRAGPPNLARGSEAHAAQNDMRFSIHAAHRLCSHRGAASEGSCRFPPLQG
jgi:hypothetical protein